MESMGLNELFGGTYSGRNVLVTGHTGFKGSWLCLWLSMLGARVTGLALDPDTSPAHWSLLNLKDVRDLRVDLRDQEALRRTLAEVQPEVVFHLAAQPLVRRSYREPLQTFETNVTGLVHLLEAVRNTASVKALLNATTDKVYLEQPTERGYGEDDPLGGHDPYSTSKACAELVTECYRKSFFASPGPRVATARAGNVIGGGDWADDRLIPDLVRGACADKEVRIRNPDAVRPWQHVLEPLSGYLQLGQKLLAGDDVQEPWNFGPAVDAMLPVKAVVSWMQEQWPSVRSMFDPDVHPYEAQNLRLDCSKAAHKLGWRPVWNADATIMRTVRWYRAYCERGSVTSDQDLSDYIRDARAAGLQWTQ